MAQLNALIPMGVRAPDLGNALAQGIGVGNALARRPLIEAQTELAQAEADAYRKYGMSPYQAANLAHQRDTLNALMSHRAASQAPAEARLYDWAVGRGLIDGGMSDIPQGDAGSPGLPGFMDKLRPSAEVAAEKAFATESGKTAATREEESRKKDVKSENLTDAFQTFAREIQAVDPTTFANAVGPIQGSDVDSLLDRATVGLARVGGSVLNAFVGSGNQTTSEVRGLVRGYTKALSAAVKPLVALKGERFTDRDQAQVDEVVGDLFAAGSKEEFARRSSATIDRLNATFGLNIPKPVELSNINPQPQTEVTLDVGSQPPAQATMAGPTPRVVQTVPIPAPQPEQPAATVEPPTPPANINQRELELIRQAREAIARGADEAAVMQRLQQLGVSQ